MSTRHSNKRAKQAAIQQREEAQKELERISQPPCPSGPAPSSPEAARERAETGRCDLCHDRVKCGDKIGLHHLVPKLELKRRRQNGDRSPTVLTALCGSCHAMLHRCYTHSELARKFPTVEAMQQDETLRNMLAMELIERGT